MSASRMRLATRLGLAFAAVVGLMLVGVVWAIVSLNQVNDQITLVIKDRFPKTRQAHDIIDALNLVARSTRNIALVSDQAAVKKEMERITDARRIIQENLDKLDASITSEEGRRLLGVMTTKRAAYVQVLDELMKMTQTAKRDDLGRFLLETMRGPQNDYMDSLMKLIEFQEGLVERDGNAAAHAVRADTIVLVSLSIASVILAAVLAWLIIRRISAQLGGEPDLAREVLANIGRGRLDNAIVLRSGDSASMMATMKAMQDSLNAFVAAQETMARRHAEGWIKEHIDASAFPGTFGKMATDINELVASHIAVKMRVVEVISLYARGDFSIDMDRLPGDKAKITAAMDEVKKSLLGVSSEIKNVVAAGVAGDFSRRIDTSRFEFMFRDMVQDLNTLAETCDVGFNDVLRVANALAAGDLSQTITKDYPGLFGQTKTGVNGTAQALAKIVGEIKNTVEAAAVRGDFSVKIDLSDKRGYTRELSELLNRLSDVTDTGLKDIARVLEAVAKGDLTEKITADYPGTFGNLKNYTNGTVRSLEQMLRQIREASETIHTAASEIASGNTDLSSRTEEQAASLEETASSMEELTSTVKQNAQNARQANQLAEGASEVAGKGGDVVGQVVTTMGAINESSRKIVDIIGVIDGIAFQTNILALNAAV
ncbi:MCP four helix bundle domain-containing protein, partial [Uliginosibacterium paludis]